MASLKRCSRCIVPETYTGVEFDDKGMCSVCVEWDSKWKGYNFKDGKKRFLAEFGRRRGKYDCIVPFSGGKDSSYILYYIKRKLGLNPLAVNLNNYLQTDIIKRNMAIVLKALNVDMITYSPDFENWCELMRRCFAKSFVPCLPCDTGIYALAYRSALMTNTNVIVFPGGKLGTLRRGGLGEALYKNLSGVSALFDSKGKKLDLTNYEITKKMADKVKVLYFGDYFDWREEVVAETVIKELGWETKGKVHARIDCDFEPLLNYLYSKRVHFSRRCSRLSAMVRDKQITREEALVREKKHLMTRPPKNWKKTLAKIGVPEKALKDQLKKYKSLKKPSWYH